MFSHCGRDSMVEFQLPKLLAGKVPAKHAKCVVEKSPVQNRVFETWEIAFASSLFLKPRVFQCASSILAKRTPIAPLRV